LLKKKVLDSKTKTGHERIDLWLILVLAEHRRTVGANWARLEHIAKYRSFNSANNGPTQHRIP